MINATFIIIEMRIIALAFILAISSFAYAENRNERRIFKKTDILQTQSITQTCIMHPEIHATKPGKCPKCGMNLVEKKE
jgi:hypothetical protein